MKEKKQKFYDTSEYTTYLSNEFSGVSFSDEACLTREDEDRLSGFLPDNTEDTYQLVGNDLYGRDIKAFYDLVSEIAKSRDITVTGEVLFVDNDWKLTDPLTEKSFNRVVVFNDSQDYEILDQTQYELRKVSKDDFECEMKRRGYEVPEEEIEER